MQIYPRNPPQAGVAFGVAYDSGKGEIFVTHAGVNNVTVISDTTNAVVATVPVGNTPEDLAYDSRTGQIFVANTVDGTVSVISDSTNAVVSTVTVGGGAFGVAYDSGKGEIFVTNAGDSTVSVISEFVCYCNSNFVPLSNLNCDCFPIPNST